MTLTTLSFKNELIQVRSDKGSFVIKALKIWASENHSIIRQLPPNRFLIIRTHEISDKLNELAEFTGVPVNTLNFQGVHSFKGIYQNDIFQEIKNTKAVAKVYSKHCESLMSEYFPGINFPLSSK